LPNTSYNLQKGIIKSRAFIPPFSGLKKIHDSPGFQIKHSQKFKQTSHIHYLLPQLNLFGFRTGWVFSIAVVVGLLKGQSKKIVF
jgi:hypothetical protein